MGNSEYGYYGDGYGMNDDSNFMQQQMSNQYKGEEVDFKQYSTKNLPKTNPKALNKFMQFEQRPEELLP